MLHTCMLQQVSRRLSVIPEPIRSNGIFYQIHIFYNYYIIFIKQSYLTKKSFRAYPIVIGRGDICIHPQKIHPIY